MTLSAIAMRCRAPHALVPVTLSLLLTACGGGSSGGGGADYTVTAGASTGGGIGPASVTVSEGGATSFTVTPDANYHIAGVSGCGGRLSGNTYTTGAVTAACTVSATFAIDTYRVSATAGSNGAISPASATVNYSSTTSFTVTPDSGYGINHVTGCDGSLTGTTYTTGAITADCAVSAAFIILPSVTIADASVVEGSSGTTSLVFTVSLGAQANGDVMVDYATSDGTATAGSDYTAASGAITINSGTTSNTISVTVNGDTTAESDETLTLTLSNASSNATLVTSSATGTLLNDDATGTLNDTGITLCGDYAYGTGSGTHNNDVDCVTAGATTIVDGTETANGLDPVPAGQDAHYGRDVTHNDDSDGHAGFSFTKIDSAGNFLAADATSWKCVLDNVTGLMWEVKTADGGLRDKGWTYTWYNSDSATNGGIAGTANGGSCYDSTNCDTEKYIVQVNGNGGLCGYSDWRLPTVEELLSIIDSSVGYPGPAIDTDWFPNTQDSNSARWGNYWSSSTYVYFSNWAWRVSGSVQNESKGSAYYVRLVRGGQ